MLITTSSSTTKNMVLWDLRFSGLEVASWSHPSKYVTPFRSWSYTADNLGCNHVFTNSAREGELSLWNLGAQDRTDVLWPGSDQPLTYTVSPSFLKFIYFLNFRMSWSALHSFRVHSWTAFLLVTRREVCAIGI